MIKFTNEHMAAVRRALFSQLEDKLSSEMIRAVLAELTQKQYQPRGGEFYVFKNNVVQQTSSLAAVPEGSRPLCLSEMPKVVEDSRATLIQIRSTPHVSAQIAGIANLAVAEFDEVIKP